MRFEKGERKKRPAKGGIEPLLDRVKKEWLVIYHLRHWSWCFSLLCCASSGSSCTLIDRCLIQSAVSNLFPNQWRCLKLYLPLPVCLICRCVFWLVILFSDLSLCFLTCYNVFLIVILFFIFAFAFVICYFAFWMVICFALIGHRIDYYGCPFLPLNKKLKKVIVTFFFSELQVYISKFLHYVSWKSHKI